MQRRLLKRIVRVDRQARYIQKMNEMKKAHNSTTVDKRIKAIA